MINNYMLLPILVAALISVLTIALNLRFWMKSQRNQRDRIWVTFSIIFVVWLLISNVSFILHANPLGHSTVSDRMIEWFFFAQFYSLYLVYRNRRACLNSFRTLLLLLPFLSVVQSMLTFKIWNEEYRDYFSLLDVMGDGTIGENSLYVISFIITLLSPLANVLLPLMVDRSFKLTHVTPLGRKYFGALFVTVSIYIGTMFYYTPFLELIYKTTLSGFILYVTWEFMLIQQREYRQKMRSKETVVESPKSVDDHLVVTVRALAGKISQYMREKKPYVDPDYNIRKMVAELNTNQSMLERAIHALGYASFRDYICDLRIDHFKRLAAHSPGASISVLMYESGFNSRATFYRRYAEKENTSPKEYVANLFRSEEGFSENALDQVSGK